MGQYTNEFARRLGLDPSISLVFTPQAIDDFAEAIINTYLVFELSIAFDTGTTFPADRPYSDTEIWALMVDYQNQDFPRISEQGTTYFNEQLQGRSDVIRSLLLEAIAMAMEGQLSEHPEILSQNLMNKELVRERLEKVNAIDYSEDGQLWFRQMLVANPGLRAVFLGSVDGDLFDKIMKWLEEIVDAFDVEAIKEVLNAEASDDFYQGIAGLLPEGAEAYDAGSMLPAVSDPNKILRAVETSKANPTILTLALMDQKGLELLPKSLRRRAHGKKRKVKAEAS